MSNRGGGMSSIPAASRKVVQSLKEIVNCPEPEIYAMLKECNMDPNDAVSRLLSQDTFHEVKSKREKKKENKDGAEPRSRGGSSFSNRGARNGGDRYSGRSVSTQSSSNDSGVLHNKPAYRKENGPQAYADSSFPPPGTAENKINRRPPGHSESVTAEDEVPSVTIGDSTLSISQPGFRSAWLGKPGQVSMADIVKMGRPHSKVSGMPNKPQLGVPAPTVSHHDLYESSKSSQVNNGSEAPTSHINVRDEWPPIEQPSTVSMSSVLKSPLEPEANLDCDTHLPLMEAGSTEPFNENHFGSTSVTSKPIQEESGGVPSHPDNTDVYQDTASFQPHRHAFEQNQAEDGVTSAAEELQHLNLGEDDQVQGLRTEEHNPTVVIPNHLQVHAPECSGLSFGSFRSGASTSFSGPLASKSSKDNSEETSSGLDAASVGHADPRNTEYYGDENLRTTSGDDLIHGSGPSAGDNDTSSASQSEVLKQETAESVQGNQYSFPSDTPGYNYESSQHLNVAFSQPQTSSQIQNLASFSNVMQGYTHSLPGTLLSSNVQTVREADFSYSPFTVTQSMPTEYNVAGSSISGPAISVTEALRAGTISSPQPAQQTLPGGSVATGPTLPQQLAVHPYSQPTLPLGHFANMIGYSFLPQSYTYMPSAFQQGFTGNSTYHQLGAMLPQYKNSVSVNNLPQSGPIAAGYGLGSSTSIPGQNFSLNPPSAPGVTTMGFDDVLSSRYKDSSQMLSLQQNDNPAMWVHGPGSRTMSSVPANTYYSFQGQNQQLGGFRQNQQQPSQHLGALGYPNFYNSQSGVPLEQQQRDGSLGGSQGQQVKQSQQIWQNGY